MSPARPRFSIVLPTRNRAGLLRHALATASAQRCDDFEVLVSDNASADDTEDVARGAGDPRVRYVRTERPLSQPDSWEFALSHARGEWVTVLGDDDGLVPSALDRLTRVIDRRPEPRTIAWSEAWYVHAGCPPPDSRPDERNVLTVEPATGDVWDVDTSPMLARFFARAEGKPVPGLVNSVLHRDLLARIRQRVGRLFPAPDPAVATITAVFALEPAYTVVDQPLGLKGLSGATISIGLSRGDHDQHASVAEFDTDDLLARVPLKSRTGNGLVAESLLAMKEALPDELSGHELDRVRYFVTVRQELEGRRHRGSRGPAVGEWRAALAREPQDVRNGVRRALLAGRTRACVRAAARAVPGVRSLTGRDGGGGVGFRVVPGDDAGFGSLEGAAAWLDAHVLQRRETPAGRGARPATSTSTSTSPSGGS